MLRLALPSDGEMADPTIQFLHSCGLGVDRPNARRYTAAIPALPGVAVLFQRSGDITSKVDEGSADAGIVGLDRYYEYRVEGGDAVVLIEDMGFSRCELVVAMPDAWMDVTSMADLIDLSVELREKGRDLRVATKYPRLVQRYFYQKGLNYFTVVKASGAMEVAPAMGYADIIADISASGTTLRENHLKTIEDGTVIRSQACPTANREFLRRDKDKLETAKRLLEMIEARMSATSYFSIEANIKGPSPEAVARQVCASPDLAGLQGPTIAPVYSKEGEQGWYSVTVVVRHGRLLDTVEHLRDVGAKSLTVTPASYVFGGECRAYRRLLDDLKREGPAR